MSCAIMTSLPKKRKGGGTSGSYLMNWLLPLLLWGLHLGGVSSSSRIFHRRRNRDSSQIRKCLPPMSLSSLENPEVIEEALVEEKKTVCPSDSILIIPLTVPVLLEGLLWKKVLSHALVYTKSKRRCGLAWGVGGQQTCPLTSTCSL